MNRCSTLLGLIALMPGLAFASGAGATDDDAALAELELSFRHLPMAARRLTGPLFWLHGDESLQRLTDYVQKVAEGGNGCFTAESRPHNDWLGEDWYRDLAVCLEAAKANDLQMWIFDEKWWPSGEVAGMVPRQFGSKQLTTTVTAITGPRRVELDGVSGPQFVALLAGRVIGDAIDGSSLIDLTPFLSSGALCWDAPGGDWRILHFAYEPQLIRGRYLVDGASTEAVQWYIDTVYQPHYDRYADDFGGTIQGFFYDEPETHGDWGTEVLHVLRERGIDWKKALVAWKFQLAGGEQAAAKYQYQDALAEAWGRTLYGGISDWCEERGVLSIGHFLEHRSEYLHPALCAGNMFQLQKYSSMGGIDAVFDQFIWGERQARDAPCWQTPKLGSSITHAYGKADDVAMVEIYGARGQDVSYPEMKWWLDHMQVSGINFIIPHSFNPRAPYDADCPPYFYNGGFEPRWPLYRVLADYSSRLTLMLSGGRHVCPVALVYLGGSAHVGDYVPPEGMSEALQDALYDCDWIPYEVLERDMRIDGGTLRLRDEAYRVLVAPAAEVIPYESLARIKQFYDAGGVVVGYGMLPTKSATLGKTSTDIAALRAAVWGEARPGWRACKSNDAGGRSYYLPDQPTPGQLQRVLAGDAQVLPTLEVLEGDTDDWLHVLHRVKAGRDVFFLTNQDHDGPTKDFRLRVRAAGVPECWDAMRGEITALPFERHGEAAELTLTMQPNESALLVFQKERRELPWRASSRPLAPDSSIAIVRDDLPPAATPTPEQATSLTTALRDCAWIWYPQGEPTAGVAPGSRYFRKTVVIPASRTVAQATFIGTADNSFTLFVNGHDASHSTDGYEAWRNIVKANLSALLRPGVNQLALKATNGGVSPNPAGVIGTLVIEFDSGEPQIVALDETWRTSEEAPSAWTGADFDDSTWPMAMEVAPYGSGPWGRVGAPRLTLSPVCVDPFVGHCDLPHDWKSGAMRVDLLLEGLSPEEAACVTVNGQDAGGFISSPLRLDVTGQLRSGRNTFRIEPFAPTTAHLVLYR